MAYKDMEKQREASRERMRINRINKKSGLTPPKDEGLTKINKTVTGVNKEGSQGLTGPNAVIPEGVKLHRYVDGKRQELKEVPEGHKVLSDGQLWKPLYPATRATEMPARAEPPILEYLIPGEKRDKMISIVEALNRRKLAGEVYLGCGSNRLSLEFVGELLDATA